MTIGTARLRFVIDAWFPTFGRRGERPLIGCVRGKPRRWIVERTNSWHNRFRALLVRWERKAKNYLALVHLASALIAYRTARW